MNQNLGRKSFQNPNVFQGVIWSQSLFRVNNQALFNEVIEIRVLISHYCIKWLSIWLSKYSSRVFQHYGLQMIWALCFCKETWLPFRDLQNIRCRYANNLHNSWHLVLLTLSRENRVAYIQFDHYTSKTPHVDSAIIRNSQHNFRCSVESWLNVSIHTLVNKSGTAKINHLYPWLIRFFQHDVLRFEITVNYLEHFEVLKCVEQLYSKSSN